MHAQTPPPQLDPLFDAVLAAGAAFCQEMAEACTLGSLVDPRRIAAVHGVPWAVFAPYMQFLIALVQYRTAHDEETPHAP